MTSKEIDEILKSPITQGAKGRFISIEQLEQIKNNLKESEQQLKVMTYDGKVYIPVKRQLTFDECIKEWEERGYIVETEIITNGIYIYKNNKLKTKIVFIHKTKLKVKTKTTCRLFCIADYELLKLITKTLKALEEMKNDINKQIRLYNKNEKI
jgi:hypothetical protein